MGKHYYYEVNYECTCEVCGKEFFGYIAAGIGGIFLGYSTPNPM